MTLLVHPKPPVVVASTATYVLVSSPTDTRLWKDGVKIAVPPALRTLLRSL